MKRSLYRLVLASLWFAAAAGSRAVLMDYEVGGGSSVSANSGSGLMIRTEMASGLEGLQFSLDDGGETTFPFFRIWTEEAAINDDDLTASAISATLDFATPDLGVLLGGSTQGSIALLGMLQGGELRWDGPVLVELAGGGAFSVTLSDEDFNWGLFGIREGEDHGATVQATVRQIASFAAGDAPRSAVSDSGSTVVLLGGAFVAGAAALRLRRWTAGCLGNQTTMVGKNRTE